MAEHQQGQHLRHNNASQVPTTTISRDHSQGKLRLDENNEHAWEDTESEPEDVDHIGSTKPDPFQSWGREAFAREQHQDISSKCSILGGQLRSHAGQLSMQAKGTPVRKELLESELGPGIRLALLKERQVNQPSRKGGENEATAREIRYSLEGTLDRHVW